MEHHIVVVIRDLARPRICNVRDCVTFHVSVSNFPRSAFKLLTFYSPMVTICATSLTFTNSTFCPHSVFVCFVWISEQTAIIYLYSINWLVFITERECVYCAVRTGSLLIIQVNICLQRAKSSLALIPRCSLSVHGLPLQLLCSSSRCRQQSLLNVGRARTLPPLKADVRSYTGFLFSRKRNLVSVTA